jgi:hypothetical protein
MAWFVGSGAGEGSCASLVAVAEPQLLLSLYRCTAESYCYDEWVPALPKSLAPA